MFSNKKKMAIYFSAVFFVSLDRFLKTLAVRGYFDDSSSLFNGLFSLGFVPNFNIAFSLPLGGPLLVALIIFLILSLTYYFLRLAGRGESASAYCLFFIILGASSNLLDRFKYGYVVDFLDVRYFTAFNIADAMIVGGGLMLLWKMVDKGDKLGYIDKLT